MKGGFHGMSLVGVQERGVVEGTNRWETQTQGMRHQCCVSESASELGNVSPPKCDGISSSRSQSDGEKVD